MKQSAIRLLDIILIVHHENHQQEQHVDQAVLDKVGENKIYIYININKKLSAILGTVLQSKLL